MKETVKILMSRDGLSQAEAVKQVVSFFKAMQADLSEGGDPFAWENDFIQEFGLEPDYFEDFIFSLAVL
jgi:hypothetical protein